MNTGTRSVVIIGSGPAGLSAAIYAARADLAPLVIEGEPSSTGDGIGGQLMLTTEVENFPGFSEGVQGPDLMDGMRKQAARFGAEFLMGRVESAELAARPLRLTVDGMPVRARSLIIATGAQARKLGLPGEVELTGRGVSSCATCDGAFFRGADVAVVGGGDAALEEAIFLTRFARSVTVIHRRDRLRASAVMAARAAANPKIIWAWNSTVAALASREGPMGPKLTGVVLRDTGTGSLRELPLDGLFVAIGHDPSSALFAGQLETDLSGYLVTDERTRTSVPGVFAAGDVADPRYRQAIVAAGEGTKAALEAQWFLEEYPQTG